MNLNEFPLLEQTLLNDWQRGFPLCEQPFAEIARLAGVSEDIVLSTLTRLQAAGAIGRLGGVWGNGAGGAAMLCAMAVPPDEVERVARWINAVPGVNHNYEREHAFNLWFVITGAGREAIHVDVDGIERRAGYPALRLPMVRSYAIDLGFDMRGPAAARTGERPGGIRSLRRVSSEDRPLAALLEDGIPLVSCPFDVWAAELDRPVSHVLATLGQWLERGTLRRLGVVVRHHDVGIAANAMTVLDVPAEAVDAVGGRLAREPGVTLCYQRQRAEGWPYNLYVMVHGAHRCDVQQRIDEALSAAEADAWPRETLFSGRRFKQTGGRYFRAPEQAQAQRSEEAAHACTL